MISRAATPFLPAREPSRDYLVDMVDQLAILARRSGEIEIAILLKAVSDAARVGERGRRPAG